MIPKVELNGLEKMVTTPGTMRGNSTSKLRRPPASHLPGSRSARAIFNDKLAAETDNRKGTHCCMTGKRKYEKIKPSRVKNTIKASLTSSLRLLGQIVADKRCGFRSL